jgi:hypothetical protein
MMETATTSEMLADFWQTNGTAAHKSHLSVHYGLHDTFLSVMAVVIKASVEGVCVLFECVLYDFACVIDLCDPLMPLQML